MVATKGLFIVLEELTAAAKTTQASKLVEWIFSAYKPVDAIVLMREPFSIKFAKEIYERLSVKNTDTDSNTKERMLELFVLDRNEHVNKIITPNLNQKAIVICDRYKYSNMAYQSSQGVPLAHVIDENDEFPIPDLTLIFNANVENCIARMEKSGKEMDKFEKIIFFGESKKGQYLTLPALLTREKFHVINANQSIEQIHADVIKVVKPLVELMLK